MLTVNYLVNYFGFNRRTKNKEKILVNVEYGITLKCLNGSSNSFIDIVTDEKYHSTSNMITKFAIKEIEKDSELFHAGLPERNLRQGDFITAYKENTQKEEFFISHEKAKKILEAQFNRHICRSLMMSSGEPNYNYYIKETKYEFRKSEPNIVTLTLYYNYKDRTGYHDFWMTHDIYNFDKENFPVNRIVGSTVPLDLIIDKFLK